MGNFSPEDERANRCIRYLSREMSKDERISFEIDLLIDEQLDCDYYRYKAIWKCYPSTEVSSSQPASIVPWLKKNVPAHSVGYFAIACSLLLVVAAFLFGGSEYRFFKSSEATGVVKSYTSNPGQRRKIVLDDGSAVTLNGNSKLDFQLSADSRIAWLEGEAFFEVVKDAHKKFVVKHNELQVEVLGTSFGVNTKRDLKQVSLLSGRILARLGNEELLYLKPNEKLLWNSTTGAVQRVPIHAQEDLAWRNNSLIFKNEKLSDAVKRMEDFYGYSFKIQGEELENSRLTGTFENQSVEEFVQALGFIANCSIKLHRTTYLIDSHETTTQSRR